MWIESKLLEGDSRKRGQRHLNSKKSQAFKVCTLQVGGRKRRGLCKKAGEEDVMLDCHIKEEEESQATQW